MIFHSKRWPFSSLDTLPYAAGNGKSSGPLEPFSSCAFHGPGWRSQHSPRVRYRFRLLLSELQIQLWAGRIVSGKKEEKTPEMQDDDLERPK